MFDASDAGLHGKTRQAVQQNCMISDAGFAQNYTLCVYLLKMRELYRWEQGLGFDDVIDREALGSWVMQKESVWDELEDSEYAPVPAGQNLFEPLQVEQINTGLKDHGLLYGAGLGRHGMHHFFLAELQEIRQQGDVSIYIAGRELARDLTAPPAMLQGERIYIRRESLRRVLWERLEEWRFNGAQAERPMGRCLAGFGNAETSEILDKLSEQEMENMILHELAERESAGLLTGWDELLTAYLGTPAEIGLRAVKDLLSDCGMTLPTLLDTDQASAVHFFFANFQATRQQLAPGLKLAYEEAARVGRFHRLELCLDDHTEHWLQTAREAVDRFSDGSESPLFVRQWLEDRAL